VLSLYVETLDQQRTVLITLTAGAVVCCEVRRSHSCGGGFVPSSSGDERRSEWARTRSYCSMLLRHEKQHRTKDEKSAQFPVAPKHWVNIIVKPFIAIMLKKPFQ